MELCGSEFALFFAVRSITSRSPGAGPPLLQRVFIAAMERAANAKRWHTLYGVLALGAHLKPLPTLSLLFLHLEQIDSPTYWRRRTCQNPTGM